LALVLTVLVGGRASVRNAAETFGLERELMGRWENSTARGGPVRLVKGQVVIVDDTVDHNALGRREPLRTTGSLPRPREVREGQAAHGRRSGPQAGRSRFPLRREEDVGFRMVNEFKTEIDLARCWTCSRSASACPGSSSTPVLSEKLVRDNVVSELKSNRTQGRARTPLRKTSQWDTSRSLLRRPDPGRPSGHGEVARRNTTRDTRQVPLHHRPLAQRGGGLPGRRSRSSKGRQGALGLLVLEEGEASGLSHDLHHQQRPQGAGGGAEPEEHGGVPQVLERHLG